MTHQTRITRPLFQLGQIVGTPGAMNACPIPRQLECLAWHLSGQWGDIDAEDRASNDAAVSEGYRILSAYRIDESKPRGPCGANTLWIITEADRSVTTLLLPDEY